ncbi:MAG: holo-ACP synthase, partial [Cyanobacteriota bacterium]|nr:holo-ACP synthase [Cyanobacteriota bacterium]
DIVHIDDIRDLADAPSGIVLTEDEWSDIVDCPNRLQRVAGRFACKEALMKVLGHGIDEIEFVDIEILNDTFGKPKVCLKGSALYYWDQMGFSQLEVSISHHKDYAVGLAVAMKIAVEEVT